MAVESNKEDKKQEDPKDKEIRELTEKLHSANAMNQFLAGYMINLGIDLAVMGKNLMKEIQQQ